MVTPCTRPAARRNEDLQAYIEGTATPEVLDHVTSCPECSRKAAAEKVTQGLLRAALFRGTCPEPEALLDYQMGDLELSESEGIRYHLIVCADCRADVAELSRDAGELEVPAWSEWLRQQLKQGLKQGRQVIQALLMPAASAPGFAVRGSGSTPLFFQAGRYQIVLVAQPELTADRSWRLQGQILQENDLFVPFEEAAAIQLLQQDVLALQDSIDEFGYFTFPRVGSGRYSLQIELSEATIRIEDVNVGAGLDTLRSDHA